MYLRTIILLVFLLYSFFAISQDEEIIPEPDSKHDIKKWPIPQGDLELKTYPDAPVAGNPIRRRIFTIKQLIKNPTGNSLTSRGLDLAEMILNPYSTDQLPSVDFTIGGKLRTYLYNYNGIGNLFFGIIEGGNPELAPILFLPGLTTDAVHMWADVANKILPYTDRSIIFADPFGIGYSDAPTDKNGFSFDVQSEALLSLLTKLNFDINTKGAPIIVSQSYGYFFTMWLMQNRNVDVFNVAFGTDPSQRFIRLFPYLTDERQELNDASLYDTLRRTLSERIIEPVDSIRALHVLLVGNGIPRAFVELWTDMALNPRREGIDILKAFHEILHHVDAYNALGKSITQETMKRKIERNGRLHYQVLAGGTRDRITPLDNMRRFSQRCSNAGIFSSVISTDQSHFGIDPGEREKIIKEVLDAERLYSELNAARKAKIGVREIEKRIRQRQGEVERVEVSRKGKFSQKDAKTRTYREMITRKIIRKMK